MMDHKEIRRRALEQLLFPYGYCSETFLVPEFKLQPLKLHGPQTFPDRMSVDAQCEIDSNELRPTNARRSIG
jgi:hypothetical protein